ncbi:MAG: PAS domain S-box protein [Halobellus sp.]|uniref:PAS domain S-box protein n=1 Tax=Halobellus sp. TaxID=1979212 RepID=UPI0035D5180D
MHAHTQTTGVLVAVADAGNRRVLVKWVRKTPAYHLVDRRDADDGRPLPAFDVCLADGPGLLGIEAELRSATRRDGSFLPCLFVESQTGAFERLHEDARALVDDIVTTPVDPERLRFRIDTLSRRRQLSEELRQAERRYRRLFELAPSPKLLVEDGVIVALNSAAEELLNVDAAAARDRDLVSFVADSDCQIVERLLTDAPAEVDASGPRFWTVEFDASEAAAICECAAVQTGEGEERLVVAQDVTERIDREQRLELYRRAMDEASVGISITDPSLPDNPLIYVNDQFTEITGYDARDVIGRNCRFLQGEGTDDETIRHIRRGLDAERPTSVTILNYRKDGEPFHNALEVTPVRNAAGEVTNYLGFQRDVTESVRQQQRLSVLDRVLRHNVRNRMNVVTGYAAQLTQHEDESVRNVAERIARAGEDLLQQSETARNFRQIIDSTSQALGSRDLVDVATEAIEEISSAYDDVEIRTEFPDTAPVHADESIKLGIVELVENAAEHGTPPVTITITADEGWTSLSVTDEGPGIPIEERNVFRADEERPTEHSGGVGLWLVRWTTERVGGRVLYDDANPATVTLQFRPTDADDGATAFDYDAPSGSEPG